MPGIGGFASAAGTDSGALLSKMIQSMCHFSWHVSEERHVTEAGIGLGRVSLGILNTESQPVFEPSSSSYAVFDGEIYDSQAARDRLKGLTELSNDASQADLLLKGYLAEGASFFKSLQGKFTAAIWDATKKQMVLVNDCFGMKPLYYVHNSHWFGFASEIKALLLSGKASSAYDSKGIAQFFGFGHYWNNETMYKSIRVLPGGAIVTYDVESDKTSIEQYQKYSNTPEQFTNRNEALEKVDQVFQAAVEMRSTETDHLGLSLSGGLDARTILGVMGKDSSNVSSICLGIEGSLDHRSSRQLAALANSPYHAYTLNHEFLNEFEQHLRQMVLLTDGHYLSQCIVMPTLPFYRELGVQVLLRGHGGELMHLRKAYNFSLDQEGRELQNETQLKSWLLKRLRAYMLEQVDTQLFCDISTQELDTLTEESLQEALNETADWEDQTQRMSQLFITQRLRRETSMSLVKIGAFVETRLPYIDRDLTNLLLTLPTDLKLGEEIQSHILKKHFPEFLNVTNVNTGARIGANSIVRQLSYYRMRVLAKLGVKGYQPYERLGLWLRQELKPLVEKILLSEQCLSRGLYRPEAVKRIVSQHSKNERNHTFLIMAMMICELGQQMFIDQE